MQLLTCHPSIHPFIYLSVHLCSCLFINPFIHLPIYLYIHPSIHSQLSSTLPNIQSTSTSTSMLYFKNNNIYYSCHPPVNLWNNSSFSDWFLSCARIDKKMYPPMNSWMVLQEHSMDEKVTFSLSNSKTTFSTPHLTCHDCSEVYRHVFKESPVLRSIRMMRLLEMPMSSWQRINDKWNLIFEWE